MQTVIVDYDSGNLHSAEKSFQRMAREAGSSVLVSSSPEVVVKADRIVLPGVGAFADCRRVLAQHTGLFEAIEQRVIQEAVPFLGICVGMQMMASWGREQKNTRGFDWIKGEVVLINPTDQDLKVPHMGWNDLAIRRPHVVLEGIASGDHAYFVHSYHFQTSDAGEKFAEVDYGGPITAAIGRDNLFGTQFHPEKSQATGLRLIANFLRWRP